MKFIKKHWQYISTLTTVLVSIVVFTWKFSAAYSEVKSENSATQQAVAKMANLQDKLFDFTMKLWGVDPLISKRWKEIPQNRQLTR